MDYKRIMKIARGEIKPELVLKNAKIINVYSGEIELGDIAIDHGKIVGIGSYQGEKEHDVNFRFVSPGLIDGHVHIESSMLTPPGFARIVVPKGTTTIIADPHEIANVSGSKGIQFMLDNSENIPLNVYMMIPSCVPATKEENSGAKISVKDIESFMGHPRVIGLGEVMDYPSVIFGDDEIHEKIELMRKHIIDGHMPDVIGNDLNAYIAAGVMTDHECTQIESMIARIRRGMYVHLREGSQTRNTRALLKGLNKENLDRVLFCTDDKHPFDIKEEGHINFNVNLAIAAGINPIDAIKMATLNAATCYKLSNVGGIAPGKDADLFIFDDLYNIEPDIVYFKGEIVAKHGEPLFEAHTDIPKEVIHTVHLEKNLSFKLKLKGPLVRVIGLIHNNITTKEYLRKVKIENNEFVYDPNVDILKLAVIERHHQTGNIGLGLVEGFGIKNGALAMTIAHDSHNLIILGSSDEDMRIAAKKIEEIQGGIVLVQNGRVTEYLELEVGGIMTAHSETLVQETLLNMKRKIQKMGLNSEVDDPFISLAFLALPVIPKLKLTDRGLFDVDLFKIVSINIDEKVSN
ncbi:MAG: adenine deaminase [Acholeplasmataceae bacterium]|nr:adenine deaminase [Acholeplasmataceae bacterium]